MAAARRTGPRGPMRAAARFTRPGPRGSVPISSPGAGLSRPPPLRDPLHVRLAPVAERLQRLVQRFPELSQRVLDPRRDFHAQPNRHG